MTVEKILLPVCLAMLSVACAATVPAPLLAARVSYASSADGPARRLAPRYLEEAHNALVKADTEFTANGDTDACRDYAYIAENKLELADSVARTQLMSGADNPTATAHTDDAWTSSRRLTLASAH